MAINYSINAKTTTVINHDADNKELYSLIYRPDTWVTGLEIIAGQVIVIPSVPNGCMYISAQGGVTGDTEPSWTTVKGDVILDGVVKWKSTPYSLTLNTGDTIQSYTLLPDTGVTIDNASLIDGRIVKFRVTAVPALTSSVNIVCRTTILTSTGITLQHDNTVNLVITPS
jgi:hypothetical protein